MGFRALDEAFRALDRKSCAASREDVWSPPYIRIAGAAVVTRVDVFSHLLKIKKGMSSRIRVSSSSSSSSNSSSSSSTSSSSSSSNNNGSRTTDLERKIL